MIDGMRSRGINETITARSTFSTPYSTIISNSYSKNNVFRSSLDFTEDELAPPTNGNGRYLIVGYSPRAITQGDYLKKNMAYDKGSSRSIGSSKPTNVMPWDSVAPPILVVTEVPVRDDGGVRFWALLWPKNGLCTPFAIKVEDVFFRWAYRTFSKQKKREVEWTQSVFEAVEAVSCSRFSTSTDGRHIPTGPTAMVSRKPGTGLSATQHAGMRMPSLGSQQEEPSSSKDSKNVARDGKLAGRPETSRVVFSQSGSSTPIPSSSLPCDFPSDAEVNRLNNEPIEQEIMQTARELHKIAQGRFKVERDKLIAESQSSTAKETALRKWHAALTQEKTVFQQGISFQASKLTERESFAQIQERRVYEREQHVHAREESMDKREQQVEKTEQKLRGWEAILTERGQVFVEREGRYRNEQAQFAADEKALQDRESAIEQDQKALDSGISDAIQSLMAVQKTRKRKAESDVGVGLRSTKQRDGTEY